MVLVPVTCPYCHSDQVIKGGKTDTGKQRIAANGLIVPTVPSCSILPTKDASLRSKSKSLTWRSMAVASGIQRGC